MKNFLTGLFFLLFSAKATAGDFYIAPLFAYSKSASFQLPANLFDPEIFHLFRSPNSLIFLRTGATISYEQKWFSYTTGLLYSRSINEHDLYGHLGDLNIFQIPLGCNLHIGKKLYGYLSVGAYLNYLYKKNEDSEYKIPDFQPGIALGIGMGYRFSRLLAIDILYHAENSLRPLYYSWLSTSAGPWGRAYWAEENIPFRTLTLSLKITIGSQNSEFLTGY